ncbi:multidrug effflux MFS transporter [Dickeya undicola]|uniref:Bcr/CflA family efflux transporter n=1 Tax=Dickeya undicola TaxID=1577887 RepID=A0A3N0FWH9_9GAMM|nr:multidrug effflux MFS transporter [Dickeya undicola]RNM04258.1 Bcr/CflA family efflux MFS transporter [Dickeya undicola]
MENSQHKLLIVTSDLSLPCQKNKETLTPKLIIILGMLSAIAALSTDVYLPLFPVITSTLKTTPAGVQLSLTTFMAGLSLGQLLIGPWSDNVGRRSLLIGGMALLTLASIICALSPNIEVLIIARFFQGAGGAAGIVLTRAIISDLGHGNRAAQYFNIMLAIQGVVPIIAPLIGGIATFFPWEITFWFMAMIAFILMLLSYWLVAESHPLEHRSHADSKRLPYQLKNLTNNPLYLGYTFIFSVQFGALFAYISASPFIYQLLFNFSARAFSLIYATNAGAMMLGSILSAKWVIKWGSDRLMKLGIIGSLSLSLLLLLVNFFPLHQKEFTIFILFAMMGTMAFIFGNAASLALAALPHSKGTGSAVLGAAQFGSAALAAPLSSAGNTLSLLPMAAIIAGCNIACLLSLIIMNAKRRL